MAYPPKHLQIMQTHAVLICEVVKAAQNKDYSQHVEPALQMAEKNGWKALVSAIKKIINGDRSDDLMNSLDEEDQVIIKSILSGIQNPSTLPDPNAAQDPAAAAPGLAAMIKAAASGDVQALQAAGSMAIQMQSAGGDMANLSAILKSLIDGERNVDKLCRGMSSSGESLVKNILDELNKVNLH